MAVLGMSVVILGYGGYLTMLFALRRFTYRTWLFHAVILVGIVLALFGLAVGDTGLPAWIAIGLGLAWFPLTRRELTLVGSERLTLQVGDRLPRFAALRPDGTPITDQDVVARSPALLVLYRGWWCPSTRALLDELLRDHERLTSAGLTTFAASVDPPAQASGMQEHVGDGITIVCSFPVAVLNAIGARDRRGAPWYDRLLFLAPRGDIAMPAALVADAGTDRLRLQGRSSGRACPASRHPGKPQAITPRRMVHDGPHGHPRADGGRHPLSVLAWPSMVIRSGIMKFLLTSAGIKNTSIHDKLVDLLGKPIADSNALCIPTAGYGHPQGSPGGAWRFISGREPRTPMCELGWKSLGVLELTALPSIDEERWVPWVRETDVLLVNGGDPLYLCHWMRQSGLADLLPSLRETVWVGLSAGSMVMTPRIGEDFVGWKPPTGGDETLGLVDFSIFPHLDHEDLPENTMADAERWAAGMPVPCYAIDDQTAIKVVDDTVEVVSEGHWKLFTP